MGLDTSHDCWHGPYSAFQAFRNELKDASGWNGDYEAAFPRNFMGWWDEDPENILDVLFIHSDCDGYIFPQHATPLADALDALVLEPDSWTSDLRDMFVAGLREAAEEWEIVVFH